MTEIRLLDGLAGEVREALEGFRLRSAKENQVPINVYVQNLPVKEGRDDEKLYPYVCVCFDEEEIKEDSGSRISLYTYCTIGIIDRERDRQGFRDVLLIASRIYQHIFRNGIIAGAFSPALPFRVKLQEDDTHPYYYGGIENRWEMLAMEKEDDLI